MRLKIENKTLKKQIDATVVVPAPTPTNNDTAKMVDEATVKALENEIEQLQAELQKEECCNCKARLRQRQTGIVHQENSVQILRNVSRRIAGAQSKIEGKT
jgi:hypothetical protein